MAKERTPRLTPRILNVLLDCFRAAEAGGFTGDTEGLSETDIDATEQWLGAWQKKYAKQIGKLQQERLEGVEEEEEEDDDLWD